MISASKQKLNFEALLPPPCSCNVSVLRLSYADLNFCVQHGCTIKMKDQDFYALCSITKNIINKNNKWAQSKESKLNNITNQIRAEIIYAPMNNNKYVSKTVDIYADDKTVELPMHAEIIFNVPNIKDQKSRLKSYARELLKHIKFAILNKDIQPQNYLWIGTDEFNDSNTE